LFQPKRATNYATPPVHEVNTVAPGGLPSRQRREACGGGVRTTGIGLTFTEKFG